MRRLLLGFMTILPFSVWGYDFSQLQEMANDPEAMQKAAEEMAKGMAEMTECADAAGLDKLRAEAEAMHDKVRALCSNGDRKGAEKVAMEYSKKFMNSTEYQQVQKCGEKMASYIPPDLMVQAQAKTDTTDKEANEIKHICDTIE